MLLLMVLPCVPGVTFLLAGWVRDPLRSGRHPTAQTRDESWRARQQAGGLYRAGTVALGAGALCAVVVGWKIVRRRDPEDEEEEAD